MDALFTSSSLFHLLGARPLYGRLLVSDDDVPGKPRVVILSHAFWARLFNSDPNVVGRTITLNGIGNAGGGPDKNQFTVALTSVMASLLFGVSATDALTFSLVPVLLTGIAIAASYLPARRDARGSGRRAARGIESTETANSMRVR